jgi:hypothetical protein
MMAHVPAEKTEDPHHGHPARNRMTEELLPRYCRIQLIQKYKNGGVIRFNTLLRLRPGLILREVVLGRDSRCLETQRTGQCRLKGSNPESGSDIRIGKAGRIGGLSLQICQCLAFRQAEMLQYLLHRPASPSGLL